MFKRALHYIFILLLISVSVFGQDSTKTASPIPNTANPNLQAQKKVVQSFSSSEIDLKFVLNSILLTGRGQVISNTLKITNKKTDSLSFYIQLTYPSGWRALNRNDRTYRIGPGDSIFLPVTIVPFAALVGNIKFIINTYVMSENNTPLGQAYFLAEAKKKSEWSVNIQPGDKLYFKNNQNSLKFRTSILNNGNEEQVLLMDFKELSPGISVRDSIGRDILKEISTFSLPAFGDTSFMATTTLNQPDRNFRRVDLENHLPYSVLQERKYSFVVSTSDPIRSSGRLVSKGRKVSFIRLMNIKKIDQSSSATLPLLIFVNISNLISNNPLFSSIFMGTKRFNDNSVLSYNSQMFYSYYKLNGQSFFHMPFTIGYNSSRYYAQIGSIGSVGGLGASGRGAKVGMYIQKNHRVEAFYTRQPNIFLRARRETFGGFYSFKYDNILKASVGYAHSIAHFANFNSDIISIRTSYSFLRNHSLAVNFNGSRNSFSNNSATYIKSGFFGFLSYSTRLLKNKWSLNVVGGYYSKYYSTQPSERYSARQTSNFTLNENWTLNAVNIYMRNHQYRWITRGVDDYKISTSTSFNNQALFNRKIQSGTVAPGLFYHVIQVPGTNTHYRGLQLNFSKYNLVHNVRTSFTLRSGYKYDYINPILGNYFVTQFTNIIQYRNLSSNIRYLYGPSSLTEQQLFLITGKYPQTIRLSLNHSHLFANTHFVLQSNANYAYNNLFQRHSFNVYPDLYYYSNSGWRFNVNINYNVIATKGSILDLYKQNTTQSMVGNNNGTNQNEDDLPQMNYNQGFFVGVGIRKELGIPIPFVKKTNSNLEFVAFYDANGNHKRDPGESPVENVVVRLADQIDTYEVLTNEKGTAKLLNIKNAEFNFTAIALEELYGWFPYIYDTVVVATSGKKEIPFVRGVKLFGNVVLDKQNVGADAGKNVDLSNIKITAADGRNYSTLTNTDGSFVFYLPIAKYTISIDENILGDRFNLIQNDIVLELDDRMENIYVSFFIVEKRRKINKKKFDANGKLINDGQGDNGANNPNANPNGLANNAANNNNNNSTANNSNAVKAQNPEATAAGQAANSLFGGNGANNSNLAGSNQPVSESEIRRRKDEILSTTTPASSIKGTVYTVQLGAFAMPLNPSLFNKIPFELISMELPNGYVRVFSGRFNSYNEAIAYQKECYDLGFTEDYIVALVEGQYKTPSQARKMAGVK